jgi:hypothetical protein
MSNDRSGGLAVLAGALLTIALVVIALAMAPRP